MGEYELDSSSHSTIHVDGQAGQTNTPEQSDATPSEAMVAHTYMRAAKDYDIWCLCLMLPNLLMNDAFKDHLLWAAGSYLFALDWILFD